MGLAIFIPIGNRWPNPSEGQVVFNKKQKSRGTRKTYKRAMNLPQILQSHPQLTHHTLTNGFLQHHHRPHLHPHQRGDPRRLRRPGILRRISRPSVHPHRPGDTGRIWWPGLLRHRLSTLCSRLTWPTLIFVHLRMYHALNRSVLQLLTLESWFLVIIPTTPFLRSSPSICTTEKRIGMGFGIIDIYISQPAN